jgi:hypothetical protein
MKNILFIAIMAAILLAMPTVVGDPSGNMGNDPNDNAFRNPNGNPMDDGSYWYLLEGLTGPGFSEVGMGTSNNLDRPNYGACWWAPSDAVSGNNGHQK